MRASLLLAAIIFAISSVAYAGKPTPKFKVYFFDKVSVSADGDTTLYDIKKAKKDSSFMARGTKTNVHIATAFKPIGGQGTWLKYAVTDTDGNFVEDRQAFITGDAKGSYAGFTIVKPGDYNLSVVNNGDPSVVYATAKFTVTPDTRGPLASTGSDMPSGAAKLSICKSIDDNWKCVGEATTWKANESFNVLLIAPEAFGTDFVGFVIFKQGADGKDTDFVNEWQQHIDEPTVHRKYATTEGLTSLSAGVYTVYAIDWRKRDVLQKNGNYPEYFSKVTLTIK